MAKPSSISLPQDLNLALQELVHARGLRAGLRGRLEALKGELAAGERQAAELDKDIAARAAALKAAHKDRDFFEWVASA